MRLRLTGATVALLLAAASAAGEVPLPDLSGAADPVREALAAEAARMAELLDREQDDEALAAAWTGLGDSYFAHDYFAEALDAYAAARALAGERGPLVYRIGLAHMAEGRLERGIEAYTTALGLVDDTLRMPALVRRGRALLDRGDTDAALNDLAAAAERFARNSPF